MKISKLNHLPSVFVLCALLVFTGCKDKSAMLVKQWKLESLKYTKEIPKDMQPQIQKYIDRIKDSFTLTYEANGKYHSHMGGENTNGTWKLNWNGSSITSITDAGQRNEYDIIRLTDNEFSFRATERKEEVIFILVPAN